MHHYVNAIQDLKGNALVGFFVKVIDPATGLVVDIFADENSTPIVTESGVENAAEVNSDGNASFYVADGEYHIDIYATDATTFVRRIEDIPMAKTGLLQADTVADLAQKDTAYPVILKESGAQGIFIFDESDLSAEVTSDTGQTTYVAPSSDETGASGAWVRMTGNQGTANGDTQTRIVSGLGIAYEGDLTFTMSAGEYYIDGILYAAAEQELTLGTADPTNPRIDVLYVDSDGAFGVIDGTPAATPSPSAVDPTTQLYLTFVYVPSAAAELTGITTENIYLENTEWTTTATGGMTLAATTDPYEGLVHLQTAAFGSPYYVQFVRGGTMSFDGDGNLIFRIKSLATWNNKKWLTFQWYSGGVAKGSAVALKASGTFGFDSSLTSAYQLVVINKLLFNVPSGTSVDELRMSAVGTGPSSSIGFRMDSIKLQNTGTVTIPQAPDFTQAIADERYVKKAGDTMSGDLVVPDEAYDATAWNGSLEVPTKNAIRDKLETLAPGGVITGALLSANNLSDVASASTSRTNLGLGTMATQAASSVAITGGSIAGITDLAVADGGTGASNASGARTNLGLGTIAVLDETTTAQYRSNTADKALSTDQVWAAADYVALTDAATVAVDMSAGFNFSLTIGGNRTLGAPTNTKNGQTGAIVITQDGTGSRTLAYHSNWKFAGGTDPTLSTAAGAVDVLFYQVISSTSIIGNLVKAFA